MKYKWEERHYRIAEWSDSMFKNYHTKDMEIDI